MVSGEKAFANYEAKFLSSASYCKMSDRWCDIFRCGSDTERKRFLS